MIKVDERSIKITLGRPEDMLLENFDTPVFASSIKLEMINSQNISIFTASSFIALLQLLYLSSTEIGTVIIRKTKVAQKSDD